MKHRILAIVAGLFLAVSSYAQQTPNISLNIPAFNTPNWGPLLNANFTTLDLLLSGNQTLPNFQTKSITVVDSPLDSLINFTSVNGGTASHVQFGAVTSNGNIGEARLNVTDASATFFRVCWVQLTTTCPFRVDLQAATQALFVQASGVTTMLGINVGTTGAAGTDVIEHQDISQSTGAIGGTTRTEILVNWTHTWTDSAYIVACSVQDTTTAAATQGLTLERIKTKTQTQVGVVINNPTGGNVTGTINCIGNR